MNETQRGLAGQLWRRLESHGPSMRLLNDPRRQLNRHALLQRLYEQRINDFNVYSPSEMKGQVRYPVFVRQENDHAGPRSELLHTRDQVHRALEALALAGVQKDEMLIVEYVETADDAGIYRKYGAFRIGGRIFGQHVLLGSTWNNKHDSRLRTDAALEENRRYFLDNPHADRLLPYFETAGIEYGRIDYSFLGDRIQIWEINDNPFFAGPNPSHFNKENKERAYLEALDSLCMDLPAGDPLQLVPIGAEIWDYHRLGTAGAMSGAAA